MVGALPRRPDYDQSYVRDRRGEDNGRDPVVRRPRAEVRRGGGFRLRAAGAVILGKTNVPFMARDVQSYNDIFGTTQQSLGSLLHAGRL